MEIQEGCCATNSEQNEEKEVDASACSRRSVVVSLAEGFCVVEVEMRRVQGEGGPGTEVEDDGGDSELPGRRNA